MVPTLALTKAVKQITNKSKETKLCHSTLLSDKSVNGGGLTFSNFVFNAGAGVPNVLAGLALAQGTKNNERIGNEVTVKSMTLQGFIQLAPYNSVTNANKTPFDVYMIIYKRKQSNDGSPSTLKEYQNNTMGDINGSISSTVLYPFNRSGYVIKKVKKFQFQPAAEIITGGTQSTPAMAILNPQVGKSTREYFKSFSVKVPIKRKLEFADANTEPKNEWFTVGFYYINGDATANTSGSTLESRATVTCQASLRYTDS